MSTLTPACPADARSAEAPPVSARRVLVVEDVEDSRVMMQILIGAWGYDVEVAADGREGLEKALRWRPDTVILDIGLPVLDGYEVARRLRQALGDDVFLIALTGYCQGNDRQRALEAGFNVHLPKPADPAVLSELLRDPCRCP